MAGRNLLRHVPLVDGHNDLPWALRETFGDPYAALTDGIDLATDVSADYPKLQTDFQRARLGGLGAQFWSVYVPCTHRGGEAVTAVLEQIALVHEMIDRYPERLGLATTADEVQEVFDSGRIASLLGAEGGHCIDDSLGALRALYRLGVRYLTLTHNDNNNWADSATDEPRHDGLTEFGERVVAEMNSLGMLVDLSHVAETTMRDALRVSEAPVIFSHSCAKGVTDMPRNVPDDVLRTMAEGGGVCMLSFVPRFVSTAIAEWDVRLKHAMGEAGLKHSDLDARRAFADGWDGPPEPTATLDDVIGHIEYVRDLVGVDHIGLGGDYDGVAVLPTGLEDVTGYPALFEALLERGWSSGDLAKLAGANVLRVLRAAEAVAAEGIASA
jgi:membrane dipeptidase